MIVLSDEKSITYADLKKIGRIVIRHESSGVKIEVKGFDFHNPGSCRETALKAISWARDVLAAEAEAIRLVPGGHISSSVD